MKTAKESPAVQQQGLREQALQMAMQNVSLGGRRVSAEELVKEAQTLEAYLRGPAPDAEKPVEEGR